MQVFDPTRCELGEGLLWHPERRQIFWFDIYGRRLMSRTEAGGHVWPLPEMGSAAGWIDRDRLLIFTQTGLGTFDLRNGSRSLLAAVEDDNPHTRSNDGGADPWGGFWLGTMGLNGERGFGSLYRWYRGELRLIRAGMTVPNVMAFDPARGRAYVSDTPDHVVWVWSMDAEGWPTSCRAFVQDDALMPDGGTVDAEGRFWSAQFGSGQVLCFDPEGNRIGAEDLPAAQVSCPRFGGPDMRTLFVTTGQEDLSLADRAHQPQAGMTFHARVSVGGTSARGVPPFRVGVD